MKRTALIIGAGFGGLSAAIALRPAGWNVRLPNVTASRPTVDAVALGQVLGDGASVADALQAHESERGPKTAVLVAQGRRTARVMRTTNPIACGLREVAIRLVPFKPSVKLYAKLNRRAGTDVTRA